MTVDHISLFYTGNETPTTAPIFPLKPYLVANAARKPTVDTFPSVDGGIATERNAKI